MGAVRELTSVTSRLALLAQLPCGWRAVGRTAQGPQVTLVSLDTLGPGTSVMQVMASDADDPTYGSSARLVYSVLDGEHHFTVDSKTGEDWGQELQGWGHKGPGLGWNQRRAGRATEEWWPRSALSPLSTMCRV